MERKKNVNYNISMVDQKKNKIYDDDNDDEMNKKEDIELYHAKILDKINNIYDRVIGSFKRGEKLVYNPNIFSNLSREDFINWVIQFNPNLKKIN